MAPPENEKEAGEYSLRDDDRPTPYAGTGRRVTGGIVVIFLLGLLAAGGILAYGIFHHSEVANQAWPEATIGSPG